MIVLSPSLILLAESPNKKTQISSNTVKSLLNGLASDNLGLKTSSAYMLGELKIKTAVIPLMRTLRNDKCDEAKIAAALALYKLGTSMSINALYQAYRFESCERVKRMCYRFYIDYMSAQNSLIE